MRNQLILLSVLSLFCACLQAPLTNVTVHVEDKYNERRIDSALVYLIRQYEAEKVVIDSQYTLDSGIVRWQFEAQNGLSYFVEAQRAFYQPTVSESGSQYEHRQSIEPDMINTLVLYLEPIPPPDPERYSRMHADISVNEVIAVLKDSNWSWAFLPQLQWEDIPALMEVGGDTSIIGDYPVHPRSTYRPETARMGLVALWLIEAIRKSEARSGENLGNLMPPSRAPILGTKYGNPKGYNSPAQIETAYKAYQEWWMEADSAENRIKVARINPLRGKGLSWM